MVTLVAAAIAVLGTLLGSVSTWWIQQRALDKSEQNLRLERLRQDRLDVYSFFAGTAAHYLRVQHDRWGARQRAGTDSPEYAAAQAESWRMRGTCTEALFRVKLIADDPELVRLAVAAVETIRAVHRAADVPALYAQDATANAAIEAFLVRAGTQVR